MIMRPQPPAQRAGRVPRPQTVRQAVRSAFMAGAFYEGLCGACPGLEYEPLRIRMSLAFMSWDVWCRRRKHRQETGFATFHFRELDGAYGRGGFERLNQRYRMFEVHDEWSPREKLTRGYKLAPAVAAAVESWLRRWFGEHQETAWIGRDGKQLRTAPPAIGSRNTAGKKVKAWRGAKVRNVVPVNIEALEGLDAWLALVAAGTAGTIPADLTPEKAQRCRTSITQLLLMARTNVAGYGNIIQCHREGRCGGRLFAQGTSLQSVPRAVRHAAMSGHYDYDFENCHFKLLEQIGRRLGIECPQDLKRYNRAADRTRKQIAEESDLTKALVKKALIADLYGAAATSAAGKGLAKVLAPGLSLNDKEIGSQRAKRLLQSLTFRRLHRDAGELRAIILHRWPNVRGGMLVNDVGCTIECLTAKPRSHVRRKLAHILQGAETAMLRAIADELGEQIEVLQHDGWSTAERLDVPRLKRLVHGKTGYRMTIKVKRLRSPAPALDSADSAVDATRPSGQNAHV